jgi:hypothetical protein
VRKDKSILHFIGLDLLIIIGSTRIYGLGFAMFQTFFCFFS